MTTNLNIVPPQELLVDKQGKITPVWWRFFENLFGLLGGYQGGGGGGQSISLASVRAIAYSEFGRTGPDYDRAISDLNLQTSILPNPAGRIADLEARVSQLETLVNSARPGIVDLTNLQREADISQALTLGVR